MLRNNSGVLKQFGNCKILRDSRIQTEDLWVRDGKIVNPEKVFYDEKIKPDVRVDCGGALISPGYIDVQINGGFGIDFSCNVDDVEGGIAKVAKGLLEHGVTSFCPTLVTSPTEVYHKILPKIKKRNGGSHGAGVLGVHIEGPFISPVKKGAHPEHCIRKFDQGFKSVTDMYGDLDNVCMFTLAPEIPNATSVIEELCRRNIKVSLGHSVANLNEAEKAVIHGASFITHLFNAMLPFHHRDPGLVGLLTSDQIPPGRIVHFGIIADGIHTHPAALRIAHRTHPEGLVLVTDAISALGLEEGIHHLGQFKIEIRKGCAYIAETNTLCGSMAELSECVRHFKEATGCTVVEALEAATLHPARSLGIDSYKGVLNFGADADFILLDEKLELLSTWISGECVYEKNIGSIKQFDAYILSAPKRSLSAFFWFCKDERGKIKMLNPEYGVGDIAKELSKKWSNADPETKSKYEAMAEKDKARYEREMTAYKKKIQNDGAPVVGAAQANQNIIKSDSEEEWKDDDE